MSTKRGKIQSLFDALDSESSAIPDAFYEQIFVVLQLSRYYPDPRSRKYYGFDRCEFWDLFDITLADSKNRRKFVSSADTVRKRKVTSGSQIKVKVVKRFWEETENGRVAVIVLQDLEILGKGHDKVSNALLRLPLVPTCYSTDEAMKPLASSRLYYMDNWTFTLASGQHFGDVKHIALENVDQTTVCCLRDVVQKKSGALRQSLLVKVMRKSRLTHYITSFREDKWPFQLPLMVADSSGWCCAVLWNNLALQLDNQFFSHIHSDFVSDQSGSIQEGSILLVKNFRVKPGSLQQKTKSYFSPPVDATVFPCELSLDIRNPKAEICIVDYTDDKGHDSVDDLKLPALEVRLMSRIDLISVPDFSVVDVAGLVTFVSQVEREPRKARKHSPGDSGDFFYRRWLHLRVGHDEPILVLVYSGDQLATFFDLRPGQYVLCRHVVSNQGLSEVTSSRQKRRQWMTTTTNSKIYIIDGPGQETAPYELRRELSPLPSRVPGQMRQLFMEGGIFRYPPYTKGAEPLLSMTFERLESHMSSLTTWRECHQLVLLARLKSIRYVNLSQSLRKRPTRKRTKTAESRAMKAEEVVSEETAEELINLWPVSRKSSHKSVKAAVELTWHETEPTYPFTTWKPCGLSQDGDQNQFDCLDFIAGHYDCELGLAGCGKWFLEKDKVSALTQSATSVIGREFVLLVDSYTNRENEKTLVLHRALCVNGQ